MFIVYDINSLHKMLFIPSFKYPFLICLPRGISVITCKHKYEIQIIQGIKAYLSYLEVM